jgi:hypothetical protein
VDEQPLPERQIALGEQRVVCRREGLGKAASLVPCSAFWHGQGGALVHEHKLGLRPASDHRHDPVARAKPLDVASDSDDFSGDFNARYVGRAARGRGVAALDL